MFRAEAIRNFIIKQVGYHPKDIVSITALQFDVSRTTVHRHLNTLIKVGKIIKTGTTSQASYYLANAKDKKLVFNISQRLDEFKIWVDHFQPSFHDLEKNVYDICEYGFTEIVNNAIDHSKGRHLIIEVRRDNEKIIIEISDDGFGIFNNLINTFHYQNSQEAIFQLSKGKLTTDPANHTGEGIFFSSRAFDFFQIVSNGTIYARDNIENDWFLQTIANKKQTGTKIIMQIHYKSDRNIKQLFEKFQDPETLAFIKTDIIVKLAKLGGERFISRSQAKRVLEGLEKFNFITLDFSDVETVGQGFVDEVFRVYQNKHPGLQIKYINANVDVEFMIKRGLAKPN